MMYVSTRGAAPAVGFQDALLAGLAPDGGLYVPAAWPRVAAEDIAAFAGAPYARVAADIVGRFAGEEIPAATLAALCEAAYGVFDDPAVTPLRPLGGGHHLLELFHGPSLAFKDIAMRLLAGLYEHALASRDGALTIVCATSGDTGGAAAAAFAGAERIRLVVLYPEGRVSEVQRRFMTATGANNVHAVAIDGDFDDCQALVKALLADGPLARASGLTAVNSINIARIAAQCVYYFSAAASLGAPDRAMRFVAPSGNFGDAYAGWAANAMGLPVERLTVATNSNDILVRALREGDYRRQPAVATQSPAMDIQVASNFERLLFDCLRGDGSAVARAFATFAAEGRLAIPPAALARMRVLLEAEAIDEAATTAAIATVFRETGRFIDPHTAVAVAAAARGSAAAEPGTPTIILSTAHPAKFPLAVATAIGAAPEPPAAVRALFERPELITRLAPGVDAVKAFVRDFAAA